MTAWGELPEDAAQCHPMIAQAMRDRGAREWLPAARPIHVRKRKDKACFLNALNLAVARTDLTYCEGLAMSIIGEYEVWTHHAWCVTTEATVVDVTWRTIGARYIGFTLPTAEVARLMLRSRMWGGVILAGL